MTHDDDLDARGLLCPLPVLKAAKRLRAMESGKVLRLVTDDPAAVVDVPHFCTEQGHHLVETSETAEGLVHLIRRN
ncbi:MAG: sulfurtransferase TusA family protein [Silicimonas sp.]|nr:sulfurtransferase TusA family protein [Silicimonas sp.]